MAQIKNRTVTTEDTTKAKVRAKKDLAFARATSNASNIRELLAYRIHVVANTISRGAALRYRREFDVTLGEWRSVALLAGFGPLGLNELARKGGVDRGQISRIVTGLIARGLVSRTDEAKGKPVSLMLTGKGRKLYEGLFEAAIDRDEIFIGALTSEERASFIAMLSKIFEIARQVEKMEKQKSTPSAA
jgi:DNA-binding MarR family transcriptional regulator